MMQPFLEKYKKLLLIASSLIGAFLLYYFTFSHSPENATIQPIEPITPLAALDDTDELSITEDFEPQTLLVDVKGAVLYPGVFTLAQNQRIIDAIEAAGGYTEHANPALINHAQKLQDEMVIYIPKVGEQLSEELVTLIQTAPTTTSSNSGVNSAGKININTANDSELTQLPGIGPSKASAIIGHREEHGKFQTIDDLKKVTGIGEKTFEQLKDQIDVK